MHGRVTLKLILHHAGLSDVGREREINEDSYCAIPRYGLFVVADGMGGHRAGDVASRMATEAISQFFADTDGEDSTWPFNFDPGRSYEENRLLAGVKLANRRIYEASINNIEVQGMGTTVVGCVFAPNREKVYIGHVGDSRCYRFRDDNLVLLTRDHSLINDYQDAMPHLTEEQVAVLPHNVITRALGMQESVVVDVQSDEPQPGDIYLLCSDGLSELVSEEEMHDVLVEHHDDLHAATKALVALANKHGGDDNITVLLIGVSEGNGDEPEDLDAEETVRFVTPEPPTLDVDTTDER